MTPKMQPKASKNAFKNEDKKQHEKLTILAPKMDPKWSQNEGHNVRVGTLGGIRKRFRNTDSFFSGFGVPLDPFWHPFRSLLGILGAFWLPFGCFLRFWKRLGPPRICRDSAANLPRFSREFAEIRRDSAENLPRFCQEFAEIQPRTRRMNPKQTCLSHCAFFESTAYSDKRFDKIAENKSGAAVSPLGGLRLNNLCLSFVMAWARS